MREGKYIKKREREKEPRKKMKRKFGRRSPPSYTSSPIHTYLSLSLVKPHWYHREENYHRKVEKIIENLPGLF